MIRRIRITTEGIVQGVGFRPFIYRLALQHRLTGWVMNTPSGVILEVQGEGAPLQAFRQGIEREAPPLARITSLRMQDCTAVEEYSFVIRKSGGAGSAVQIAPDCDVCSECLAELFDPRDRRYRYPFINCTNCGPRYSITMAVPYDRCNTTMAGFVMCEECRAEYEDPSHRRFHAQPIACPVCGPRLTLLDSCGKTVAGDPLDVAVKVLREGRILALKGIGGYHLAVDAFNHEAVRELRQRKKRDEKPFAVMSPDLSALATYARCGEVEKKLLSGPERPIVLTPKLQENRIASLVAPRNGYFGAMLPSTPLHHLLLRDNFPALVMTSGNISDEPICYRDAEALERLSTIADFLLTHDREIHTRTDDSVIRVFRGAPLFLRRSRGYVPRGIKIPEIAKKVLAVGADMKSAACLTRGNLAFLSQHIGDLANAATLRSLEETVAHLERTLKIVPEVMAYDLHPDYLATAYGKGRNVLPQVGVQHHHAHMASCMAENGLEGEAIGVIFDGTGYGTDGTIWGGEFLVGGYTGFERKGHFGALPLPGGDAAVREPYRMALSYLNSAFGAEAFDLTLPCVKELQQGDRKLFAAMLEKGLNSPPTSSCGRLFDAVAALLGVRCRVSYEGQAAVELEAMAETARCEDRYRYEIRMEHGRHVVDFAPMIRRVVSELEAGRAAAEIARSFHNTVAAVVADVCCRIRSVAGVDRVVLSGGVFQNRLLSEKVYHLLTQDGFEVFTQHLAPPNDGGIALGQAVVAARSLARI